MKESTINHVLKALLLFVFAASLLFNMFLIFNKVYAITFDQGRDLIWSYNQILFHKPSLVGPWGSISGVFFGPLWFWILGIALFFASGDPSLTVVFNMVIVYLAGALLFIVLKKSDYKTALVSTILYFASPYVRSMAGFAFSQHLLPLLTAGFLFLLVSYLNKHKIWHLFCSSLLIGLMFHAEPPAAIYTSIALVIILIYCSYKNVRLLITELLVTCFGIIIPLLPLAIFDLRHGFIQTKSLISYLTGETKTYNDITSLANRILDRPGSLLQLYYNMFVPWANIWIGTILLLFVSWRAKYFSLPNTMKNYFKYTGLYILLFYILVSVLPVEFKPFYLDGIVILVTFILGLGIRASYSTNISQTWIIVFSVYVLMLINPVSMFDAMVNGFRSFRKSTSVYANQSDVIGWVYSKANGRGFKMYTYVPQIYDYPYQYLVSWQGLKQYGYLPEEYSYLQGKSGYVEAKDLFLAMNKGKIKPSENLTFLIIEPGDQLTYSAKDWIDHFPPQSYVLIEETKVMDGTQIKMLYQVTQKTGI